MIIEGLHLDPRLYIRDFEAMKASTASSPVFVPIVLQVDSEDYRIMAEQWIQDYSNEDGSEVMHRLMTLQDYLVGFDDVHVCSVGIVGFQQALDELHDFVLEAVISS